METTQLLMSTAAEELPAPSPAKSIAPSTNGMESPSLATSTAHFAASSSPDSDGQQQTYTTMDGQVKLNLGILPPPPQLPTPSSGGASGSIAAKKAIGSPNSGKEKIPLHLRNAPLKRISHATEKSLVWSFLVSVVGVTVAIVLGVPLMAVTMLVLFPLALLIRLAINHCSRCLKNRRCSCRLNGGSGLSANDAAWWQANPFSANVTHTLLFFERGLGVEKMKEMLQRKVVLAEVGGCGRRLYPRFSQRVSAQTAGYCWTDDENFDIDNHVRAAPPVARTRDGLQTYLGALVNQTLHPERSPWEVQVLMDYGEHGETVLIVRTHHSLSDAVALIKILRRSLADAQTNQGSKARFGGTTFPLNVFRAFIVGPMTLLSWLAYYRGDRNWLTRHPVRPGGPRVVAWSDDIHLSQVVRIKQVSRSTLNDVILSALTGSLRSYFQKNGIKRPFKMTANLSVDLRYESRSAKRAIRMGTKFALVNIRLPTNREGAIPRLWDVRSLMDDLKTSADPVVMYGAVTLLGAFLPSCVARKILGRVIGRASLAYHNVPGPEHALHALSMRLKSIVCLIPPRDSVPVSVTVTTNADVLKVALLVDQAVMPDPHVVIDEFVAQMDIMTKLLSSRRIPGEHRRRSYFIIAANTFNQRPPVEEIQNKLHAVQDELHEITQRLDAAALLSADDQQESLGSYSQLSESRANHLRSRVEELKEEFSDLLAELRRRKSVADGVPLSDEEEDLDGEVRRPRKRTLSMTSRKSSISMTSTARPLATPTTSFHSSLGATSASAVVASAQDDVFAPEPSATERVGCSSSMLDQV